MGQKTHPIGFRLGGVIDWQSQWFANKGKDYAKLTNEDREIRDVIVKELGDNAAISKIEIERNNQEISITVFTARPGIIIGRGGTRVEELKNFLESKGIFIRDYGHLVNTKKYLRISIGTSQQMAVVKDNIIKFSNSYK